VSFSDDCFDDLRKLAASRKCFLIIDETVYRLYQKKLKGVADPKHILVIKSVESSKNLKTVEKIIHFLIKNNFKRNDLLVAVGGGIIEDVAGFTSSILFRGVDWVFCPTTLLAQADSCIGSKNCINVDMFKNQLGTFFPPTQVILDTVFLRSLDRKDIHSGLGEIIKFSILDSRKSFEIVRESYQRSLKDWSRESSLKSMSLTVVSGTSLITVIHLAMPLNH
jgi:3-dehydroquinate synthase